MFSKMFNQVNLIQKGMDASWLRHEVISHNLANADTPGYKTQHVSFEGALKQAMEKTAPEFIWATQNGHFEIASTDPSAVEPEVVTERHHTMRMDGNNVDADREMTNMAANTITYNALTGQMTSEFSRLRMAIKGDGGR
ncbi:MAG: flagellar basal body rod protein FlgB [Oscillospiraceae bacterium]|nr:flagellar basal body rod protein FlgB [Oscillospiraceae bacterium]